MRYLWITVFVFVTTLAVYGLFASSRRAAPVSPAPLVSASPDTATPSPSQGAGPVPCDVQLALILDTSSSMDGLIQQARAQLWEMVGEMQADGKGKDQAVALALYQYGSGRLSEGSGYIEKLSDFTLDLEPLANRLQSLQAGGEQEHAPQAILQAVEELTWSGDEAVRKVIVIAGNEGFAQGPVTIAKAIDTARARGIRVVPIFCASESTSAAAVASWRKAATLAGVELESIDPNKVVEKVETPFDREILQKLAELRASQQASAPAQGGSPPVLVETAGMATADQVEKAGVYFRQTRSTRSRMGQKAVVPGYNEPSAKLEKEILELQTRRQQHLEQSPAYQASRKDSLSKSVLKSY